MSESAIKNDDKKNQKINSKQISLNPKLGIYTILGGFAVVVLVNICYIFLAQTTWRGISEENSYKKGLRYNDIIAQKKRQEATGINLKTHYNSKTNELTLELLDAKRKIISEARIEIRFKRMLQKELDFTIKLQFVENRFFKKIDFPAPGKWKAEIIATLPQGEIFQSSEEFFIHK